MSGKVLYRKYRPTQLADVVGQTQVTDALQNALKQKKVGHAYLFIGPRGTGKTSVARIFAHAVNDFDYQVEDSYLDIIEIDAASNTGVDNIRELREKAIIAPTNGKYKVYIIDEVHMLTKSASNALLKTLEEPPEHVIFIMATTDAHKVPITISSRTQVFTFKLADPEIMFQHLKAVAKKEKINITDDALRLVVRRGGGSFRDSMSLLDQVANLTDGEISAEILSQALGLPQEQAIYNLLQAYANRDMGAITTQLKTLLNTGIKPEIIASELIETIIAQPQPAFLPLLEKLPAVQPPFPEAKLLLALLENGELTNIPPVSMPPITTIAPQSPTESQLPTNSAPAPQTHIESQPPTNPTPSQKAHQEPKNSLRSEISSAQPAKTAPNPSQTVSSTGKSATSTPQTETSPVNTSTSTSNPEPLTENPANPTSTPATPSNNPPTTVSELPTQDITPSDTTPANLMTTADFNWDTFLTTIQSDSKSIALQLQKVDYELKGDTLHLYPSSPFTKGVLSKPAHIQKMLQYLDGITISVHNTNDHPAPKDPTLSQLSDIMGDVKEIKGDLPF